MSLADGEVLFHQGDDGERVYVVESGAIEIFRELGDGSEERLTVVGPGNYFGELAPMFGLRRSAGARAIEGPAVVTGLSLRELSAPRPRRRASAGCAGLARRERRALDRQARRASRSRTPNTTSPVKASAMPASASTQVSAPVNASDAPPDDPLGAAATLAFAGDAVADVPADDGAVPPAPHVRRRHR